MKKLISVSLIVLAVSVAALAQQLPSTGYTRELLRSVDAAAARSKLGVYQTNFVPDVSGVRPEEFGAVGNGTTSDTIALQAAIVAAIASNSPVLLTRTYLVTNTLEVTNIVTILGTRQSSQLAHLYAPTIGGKPILRVSGDNDGLVIRNVTMLGPGRDTAGSIGLLIDGAPAADTGHIEVSGCRFGNSEYGLYASAVAGASFRDCIGWYNRVGGIITNAVGNGVVVQNWIAKGQPEHGLVIDGASAVAIVGMEANATNRVLWVKNSRVTLTGANLEHITGTDLGGAALYVEGTAASVWASAIYTRHQGRSVVLKDGGRLTYANVIWGTTGTPKLVAWDETSRAYFLDLTARDGAPEAERHTYLLTNSVTTTTNFVPGASSSSVVVGSTNETMLFGLVDAWTMEEADGANRVGNWQGTVLTDQGGNVPGIAGRSGRAAVFKGTTDQRLRTPSSAANSISNWTLAAWVCFTNATQPSSAQQWIVGKADAGGHQFGLYYTGSGINRFRAVSGGEFAQVTEGCTTQVWYFVCGRFDGTALRVSINNVYPGTNTSATAPPASTTPFTVGCQSNNASAFHGLVDDVRVWNRALTDAEVTRLYAVTALTEPTAVTNYGHFAGGTFTGHGGGLAGIPQAGVTGLTSALAWTSNRLAGITHVLTNGTERLSFTNGVLFAAEPL